MREKEVRTIKVEFRQSDDGKKLSGMPIVYERESEDMGFIEVIERGAAKEALMRSDPVALYGHNSDSLLPLGRMSAGTLRAVDTDEGVDMEIDPPDTQFARDLSESIRRGDVKSMSFAFVIEDDAFEKRNGKDYRIIKKFREILDFSFVTYPAYPDTTVALRSLEQHKKSIEQDSANAIAVENEDIDIDLLIIGAGAIL